VSIHSGRTVAELELRPEQYAQGERSEAFRSECSRYGSTKLVIAIVGPLSKCRDRFARIGILSFAFPLVSSKFAGKGRPAGDQ
jgi:hypothetical protein